MVFDLTTTGVARVSMTGYVEDMLRESGTIGVARTPATASLFNVRDDSDMATEEQQVKFHRLVAKMPTWRSVRGRTASRLWRTWRHA